MVGNGSVFYYGHARQLWCPFAFVSSTLKCYERRTSSLGRRERAGGARKSRARARATRPGRHGSGPQMGSRNAGDPKFRAGKRTPKQARVTKAGEDSARKGEEEGGRVCSRGSGLKDASASNTPATGVFAEGRTKKQRRHSGQ